MPGPSIGEMRTTLVVSLTVPELRQATSASRRHGSRSPANCKYRPQPASVRTTETPTIDQRTPRDIPEECGQSR
jgi:hypothetical protein